MARFLIIKLDGPMQAWGGHTYEDYRPSHLFPTRSGLLGLLAACLGIARDDVTGQAGLAESVSFTVRADTRVTRPELESEVRQKRTIKLTDYHTVLNARRATRDPRKDETVQSWREYLFDACFTVAVEQREGAAFPLEAVATAIGKPVYTPFLGRRACPLARPLLHGFANAESAIAALDTVEPGDGTIYAETDNLANEQQMLMRDVPMHARHRQFGTRKVYIHARKAKV